MKYIGLDIGGTKCAVCLAKIENDGLTFLSRESFPTSGQASETVLNIFLEKIKEITKLHKIEGIGISCGGPLNSEKGIILSPPNLKGWDEVRVVDFFEENLGIKTRLCNDANACALAEWSFGAGRGSKNMLFLTFGTGFGAGLILDGKLYSGTSDMAGEIGHVRLTKSGGVGYGKIGSVESWCSGGGLKQMGIAAVKKELLKGNTPKLLIEAGNLEGITARLIAELAISGDTLCLEIYRKSGKMLGKALSILIDLLNPQKIVIGSIFARSGALLIDSMKRELKRECLPQNLEDCQILPAELGDEIGDYAAITVARGRY